LSHKRKRKEAKRAARKEATRSKSQARVQRDAFGRAHLVVHRDERGRPTRLALSRPLFNDSWQNEVAAGAAAMAHGILSQGHTVENAAELGRSAMSGTSKIAEGALRLAPEHALACRPGCAHCCYQAVGVTAPEVFAIHEHLRATRTLADLAVTARRIREADDVTRGMSSTARLSPAHPCPFLQDERCSIYEVRPLACRGKNSLDASACERTLREPDARDAFLAGRLAVPCYVEPIRAFHAVTAGMQLALHELHELQAAPLELTVAMRLVLDDPDGTARAWLAGADPFAAARGGDVSADPRILELAGRAPEA
jgi:hypothetical protein